MNYYLGIDIGTSSVKVVAFTVDGEIITQHNQDYPIYHPQPGWSEQDPDEIFEALLNSINTVSSRLSDNTLICVSVSAAMHSLIALNEQHQALTPCIIWADNRASGIATEMHQKKEAQFFYQKTGVPVHAMSPLCKIVWLKKYAHDIFRRSAHFVSIKEYIFYRLFGKYLVDTGIASTTGLLNIHQLQWDEDILAYCGIRSTQLSPVVQANHTEMIKTAADSRLKQLLYVPVAMGSSDGALANLGSGAANDGDTVITIGTSSAVRRTAGKVMLDPAMRTFCYHICPGKYIVGGAGNNGAVAIQWLKEKVTESSLSYAAFLQKAANVQAGSEQLIFIPYIMGERAPVWNSDAKGCFFGLTVTHTQAHLIRACMEGVVYNVYGVGKVLAEQQPPVLIYATGGFTQSTTWLQILSDMFNCPVAVAGNGEAAAWGAVLVGLEALQVPSGNRKNTNRLQYQPSAANHNTYLSLFEKFERLYTAIKREM